MPTYDYQREDGTTFEVMQRITDDPLGTCPTTGQKVKRKIGGGAGLIFKGNGFYLTDYARKKSPTDEKSSSKNGSSGGKKSAGSSTSDLTKGSSTGNGSTSSSSTSSDSTSSSTNGKSK